MRRAAENKLSMPLSAMIDVVFQLLIFFIVTSRDLAEETHLPLRLPGEKGAAAQRQYSMLTIFLTATTFLHDSQPLTPQELSALLHAWSQQDATRPVSLKISPDSPAQMLVTVLDLCSHYRLENISLYGTCPEEGKPGQ